MGTRLGSFSRLLDFFFNAPVLIIPSQQSPACTDFNSRTDSKITGVFTALYGLALCLSQLTLLAELMNVVWDSVAPSADLALSLLTKEMSWYYCTPRDVMQAHRFDAGQLLCSGMN